MNLVTFWAELGRLLSSSYTDVTVHRQDPPSMGSKSQETFLRRRSRGISCNLVPLMLGARQFSVHSQPQMITCR